MPSAPGSSPSRQPLGIRSAQPLGIIAGTGFRTLATLTNPVTQTVDTAFGPVTLTRGHWHDQPICFVPRHGPTHAVPPHLVNYRALITALKDAGCTDVVGVNVTGGIDPTLTPGSIVVLDDFLDFTKARVSTFHDGTGPDGVVHIDVAQAYHLDLRADLLRAAASAGVVVRDGGVYVCFEGPRFESPAEIRMAGLLGGHVVGMTGVPEVTLAAEAGLRYAAVSLVVNPAAGLAEGPITIAEVDAVLAAHAPSVVALLDAFVAART